MSGESCCRSERSQPPARATDAQQFQSVVLNKLQTNLEQSMQDIVETIKSPADYEEQFELLLDIIIDQQASPNPNTLKPESHALLEIINQIVSNSDAPPYTRFASLMIVRDLFARKYTIFINCLPSSKLFKTMADIAKTIDAKKSVEQKGRNFMRDPDLGNKFMRLILESIQKWAERYPLTSSQTPSRFKLTYNELVEQGVVFPKTMEFYASNEKKDREKQKGTKAIQKVEQTKTPSTPKGEPIGSIDKRSAEQLLKQSLSKIQGFVRFLEQCDDEQQLLSEIQMYHKLFQQEVKKNHSAVDKILSENLLSEEMVKLLFLVGQFYTNEEGAYLEFLTQRPDLKSYIDRIILDAGPLQSQFKEKQRAHHEKTKPSGPVVYQAQQIEQPRKTQQPRIAKKLTTEYRSNTASNPDKENPSRYREETDPVSLVNVINDKELEQIAEQGHIELNQFWSNVNPTAGFRSIKRQLQSELGNRPSKSRSRSVRAVSRSKRVRGELSPSPAHSKSKLSYFDLHPDIVVANNSYTGSLVLYANEYQVGAIDEHQGSKRLKKSNIADKGILFENQLLQIGYKSEPCYEEVNGYTVSLKLILYYGNKSESMMTRFQVEFEGDQNSLLYRNPQYLPEQIAPGHQIKQELLIIPISLPYSLMSVNIQYSIGRQFPDFTVYLPNSLLKYLVSHPTDVNQFESLYNRHLATEFRSQVFPLSQDLDPTALQKLFPQMVHLTKKEDFISQKRYTQLVLGLKILLVDSDEPNMTVVLQLVILDNSDDSENYAKFLLQSLQFLLQSA